MKFKKALITGITGQDGSYLAEFLLRKKQGFIFDVERWVFNNLDLISNKILNGHIIKDLNKNIVKLLSINKSRINGQRIWKLFVLEHYLERVLSKSS